MGTWWSQCRAGRRATAGRDVGRGERRAVGPVSRGRLILGRTVAVRPAIAGGRMGTPSRSRGAAVAAGGSAVSPADMRTVPRPAARAPVSVSLILALVGRPRQSPPAPPRGSAASVAAGAAAPPTGALMAPPRAPGLHESRRRTERGSLAAALYWKTTLWYNLNCTVGGGRICTPPES